MNREQWLTELAKLVELYYKDWTLDSYRLSCSWPTKHALGKRIRRLGECHGKQSSKAGLHEIFISPLLEDSLEVAGTVCHELAHVAAGVGSGHGPKYKRVCVSVGLTKGKPTVAMPGERLNERLNKHIEQLGNYPHQAITPTVKAVEKVKDITLQCRDCGCLVRMSAKWLARSNVPTCGCGGAMVIKIKNEE